MKLTILTLHAALVVAISLPAAAASLDLVNDPATGGPGKIAVEEIRCEALARGMAVGEHTLKDDGKRSGNENGLRK